MTSFTPPLTVTQPFFRGSMPLPPSVNDSYEPRGRRSEHQGGIAATAELVQFKKDAALMLSDVKQNQYDWDIINKLRESNNKRCQTPLAATIRFYFPTEWKRDVDGPIKAALDAAFARLGLDDRLVVKLDVQKLVDPVDPHCEIEVCCVVR